MSRKGISKSSLQRLPVYLEYLKSLNYSSEDNISATSIAAALGMGEVQVRKDLASVSGSGRPKVGYNISDLIQELESFLGYDETNNAVIIGAGKLGKTLLGYNGFRKYGLNIVAAFDIDDSVVDTDQSIFPLSEFPDICKRLQIRIGIITVPAGSAQAVCDLMVQNGILAIWNFAPTRLVAPPNILVQHENMAVSLSLLSRHLSEQLDEMGNRGAIREKI